MKVKSLLDFIKLQTFFLWNNINENISHKLGKNMKFIYLTENLHLKYTKNIKIYKESYHSTIKKQKSNLLGRKSELIFSTKGISKYQINIWKHTQHILSLSLQIITTVKYDYTSITMAEIQKYNTNYWQECTATDPSSIAVGNTKWYRQTQFRSLLQS